MTTRSLVLLRYKTTVGNIAAANGTALTGGNNKSILAQLVWNSVPTGSPFIVGQEITSTHFPFANVAGGGGYVFGNFSLQSFQPLMLDPGTYGITLRGGLYSVDLDTTGIRAAFGMNTDNLDVIVMSANQSIF